MVKIKDTVGAILLTAVIVFLVVSADKTKSGALQGYALCEKVIIPSLLPLLILTNLLQFSRGSAVFEKMLGVLFEKVLRLPRCTVPAVLFGLIGGYPAGAILTGALYREGAISQNTAKRMLCFDFCGGVAFILTAVGGGRYQSFSVGLVLFVSCILSSLLLALFGALFEASPVPAAAQNPKHRFSDALCLATEQSTKSVLLMSAYILLFSAVTALFSVPEYLTPLFEITGGLFLHRILPLPYAAFFLSFGGLCIHLQLMGVLKEVGMPYARFFLFRLAGALLAFFICKGLLLLFPQSVSTVAPVQESVHFSQSSVPLGILFILGCAVLVFDIENRKLKLISDG